MGAAAAAASGALAAARGGAALAAASSASKGFRAYKGLVFRVRVAGLGFKV